MYIGEILAFMIYMEWQGSRLLPGWNKQQSIDERFMRG